MSSTGYASRAFSIPKGRDRFTMSYKVDKHPSKKITHPSEIIILILTGTVALPRER